VQKSATTWLQSVLQQHPDIFCHEDELHFFDEKFHKGVNWYHGKFPSSEYLRGEKTGAYAWLNSPKILNKPHDIHERIFNYNRDIKLIFITRDPVKRAISAFHHHQRLARISHTTRFDDYVMNIRNDNDIYGILTRGLYYENLSKYFAIFPHKNILVLDHEEIKNNPNNVLKKVFKHLRVKNALLNTSIETNRYSASLLALNVAYKYKFGANIILRSDRKLNKYLKLLTLNYPDIGNAKDYLNNYYLYDSQKFIKLLNNHVT
jgi:hypothetical protein